MKPEPQITRAEARVLKYTTGQTELCRKLIDTAGQFQNLTEELIDLKAKILAQKHRKSVLTDMLSK